MVVTLSLLSLARHGTVKQDRSPGHTRSVESGFIYRGEELMRQEDYSVTAMTQWAQTITAKVQTIAGQLGVEGYQRADQQGDVRSAPVT